MTDLQIVTREELNRMSLPKETEQIALGEERILLLHREGVGLPIVEFRMTEGHVCMNKDEVDETPHRYRYALSKKDTSTGPCKREMDGSRVDHRFKRIGSVSEATLFRDNNVAALMKGMPRYEDHWSEDYSYNLYTHAYYDWDLFCEVDSYMKRPQAARSIGMLDYVTRVQV